MLKMKPGDVVKLITAAKTVDQFYDRLEEVRVKAETKFANIIAELNEAKEEAREVLDNYANEAQEYFDNKSENWQESDKGQAYQEWAERLFELSNAATEDAEGPELPEIERPDWVGECAECEFSEFEF